MARIHESKFFPGVAASLALIAAASWAGVPEISPTGIAVFLVAALLLPLFPFHGLYLAALTRLAPRQAAVLAALLPAAGGYLLARLGTEISADLMGAAGALALFGAVYGSLKALTQSSVPGLLAYVGLGFYSTLWVALAAGQIPAGNRLAIDTASVALLTAGLLFVWDAIRPYSGNWTLDRMHGLARSMPRLAVVMALLVMAAAGFPPFGLLAGPIGMLLVSPGITWGWTLILLSWFLASWCLFRMMQRLLFGPPRSDVCSEDLPATQLAAGALLVLILVGLGAAPWLGWSQSEAERFAVEVLWPR